MFWRQRDSGKILLEERSIGRAARATSVCRNEDAYELVHPFDERLSVDDYSMTCMLRYFRECVSVQCRYRNPNHVAFTGRPEILNALRPFLQDTIREAGFHDCTFVEERACLATEAGTGRSGLLLFVDVGHVGTRFHVLQNGRFMDSTVVVTDGGKQMLEAIVRGVLDVHGLLIGPSMAREILTKINAPELWPCCRVKGKDVESGMPRTREVPRGTMLSFVRPHCRAIADICQRIISDLWKDEKTVIRIVLAGAAADSEDLLEVLRSETKARVELRPNPGEMSARGLAFLLGSRGTTAGSFALEKP